MKELATALAKAQTEIQPPALDAVNPHFKSRYTTLAAVRAAIVPVAARHGIAILQSLETTPEGVAVTTILLHGSGEELRLGPFTVPATKKDAQGFASAATYGRRISLLSAFALAGEDDDDGNAAVRPAPATQAVAPPAPPAPDAMLLQAAREAAMGGTESFRAYWAKLPQQYRRALHGEIPAFQAAAKAADEQGEVA